MGGNVLQGQRRGKDTNRIEASGDDVPDTSNKRLQKSEQEKLCRARGWQKGRATAEFYRWLPEPSVGRVADGVPDRVGRLKSLGNAVVPQVAEHIGRMIIAFEKKEQ